MAMTLIGQSSLSKAMDMINQTPSYLKQCVNQWNNATKNPLPKYQTPQQTQISTSTPQNYSFNGKKVEATGLQEVSQETANEKLQSAQTMSMISTGSNILSSFMEVQNARRQYKDVKNTKSQYETQKKIIDTNIENQETLQMENLEENMANLNVMTASKNVDLTSEAVTSQKDKALEDMSKDFRDARTAADLNKKALDLDYAMNARNAAQNYKDTATAGLFNIGTSLLNMASGGFYG